MNPRLERLQPYPFERLRRLMHGVQPAAGLAPIALSVGEPRHATPAFIQEALTRHLSGLSHYPATLGSDSLRAAIAHWLQRRFGLKALDPATEVLPTLGSREALFSVTQVLMDPDRPDAYAVCPNPFYQIYEGAALLAGGQPWFVNADPERNFLVDYASVPSTVWARTQVVFACSPGNPTGRVMTLEEWRILFELSDRYGFTIVSDECYSEIYPDESSPPLGSLQAAQALGRSGYPRLIAMGSLSKRSNVPGLRSAFAAGDRKLLQRFALYRTYHGSAMNPAVQAASETAWQDEVHVQENRRLYREKMEAFHRIVHPHLPLDTPQASFYYWARTPVPDTDFAVGLMRAANVAVLPGSLLARAAQGTNPGQQRIRIALVGSLEETVEAAHRLVAFTHSLQENTHVVSPATD
ncbi:MAG: succinyldiaminopimelate transaminase [Betaproteobacteria bacterium]|nr:succinyldiaminopimelate transaminase [Betaproteobacteria bacterium]